MNKKIGIFVLFALFIFSLFVPLVTADTAPVLDEGLVLYLPFDEGSGSTAIDQSGNGNHGTITGCTYVSGVFGTALSLGSANKIEVPDNASLDVNNFSVSCWLNRTSNGDFFSKFGSEGQYSFLVAFNGDGKVFVALSQDGTAVSYYESLGTFPTNEMTMFTLSFNSTTQRLRYYFNGELDSEDVTTQTAVFSSTEKFQINNVIFVSWLSGVVDDFRLYNRTLTQSEITFLFENPQPTPTPAPSATPIPQDMATSAIMSTIILVILVIVNIVFLGVVHSVMVRFLFALLTLMIGIASLTMQQITFNPYLQMVTVVMSLLCMVLAAKAKG